jgi:tetratricopeptide (TPR) repeat protein
MADAAARARELSTPLPREERMVIEVRVRMIEGGRAFEPDYAKVARQLFKLFPDTVTYGYWVARAQQREKDLQGALATIDAISRLPEGRQDLLVLDLEAQLARGSRDFKRAARALEQSWALAAPALDPGFRAGIRADQAFVARELGELHKARAFGEEAARLNTTAGTEVGLQQVRGTLASIYRELGDFARARTTYEQRIAFENSRNPLGPAEKNIRYNLAIELFHHGDLADARTEFEQVIRETGSKPLPYIPCAKIRLGVTLHRLGDLAAARRFVDEVLSANPKDRSQCQGESGRVFFEQGELDQARAVSNELAVQTRIALAAGDLDRAHAMLQEALPLPPNPRVFLSGAFLTGAFEVAMVQARIALEEGRASDARREAELAVKLAREDFRPDDEAAAEAVLALAWLAEGRLREAQQAIARLEKRLTVTQDRLLRLSGGISIARVQAASKGPDQIKVARQRLEALIREAADIGAVAIAFDARLALGEIEMKAGETDSGRARLAALERDAKARGFINIATKGGAAAR